MRISDEDDLEKAISKGREAEISEDRPVKDLYQALLGLKHSVEWGTSIRITNKPEQLKLFREALEDGEDFSPEFKFQGLEYELENVLSVVEDLNRECLKVDGRVLDGYGFEKMTPEHVRNLFRGSFEELALNARAAESLSKFEEWRDSCRKIWPRERRSHLESRELLESREFEEQDEKELNPEKVADMFEKEIARLGIDYSVELREVSGCHNVPEDRTVVVARGSNLSRKYSRSEAEMLAKHEIFHVVRAHNGQEAARNGFPPLLGIHTPFYDRTEEGGATLREFETGVIEDWKVKDYHLRNLASHHVNQGMEFMDAAGSLMKLGASPGRAFALLARNREVLRHHIYVRGQQDWRENDPEALMTGKVNPEWAEKVQSEIDAGGAFGKPDITAEEVFNG